MEATLAQQQQHQEQQQQQCSSCPADAPTFAPPHALLALCNEPPHTTQRISAARSMAEQHMLLEWLQSDFIRHQHLVSKHSLQLHGSGSCSPGQPEAQPTDSSVFSFDSLAAHVQQILQAQRDIDASLPLKDTERLMLNKLTQLIDCRLRAASVIQAAWRALRRRQQRQEQERQLQQQEQPKQLQQARLPDGPAAAAAAARSVHWQPPPPQLQGGCSASEPANASASLEAGADSAAGCVQAQRLVTEAQLGADAGPIHAAAAAVAVFAAVLPCDAEVESSRRGHGMQDRQAAGQPGIPVAWLVDEGSPWQQEQQEQRQQELHDMSSGSTGGVQEVAGSCDELHSAVQHGPVPAMESDHGCCNSAALHALASGVDIKEQTETVLAQPDLDCLDSSCSSRKAANVDLAALVECQGVGEVGSTGPVAGQGSTAKAVVTSRYLQPRGATQAQHSSLRLQQHQQHQRHQQHQQAASLHAEQLQAQQQVESDGAHFRQQQLRQHHEAPASVPSSPSARPPSERRLAHHTRLSSRHTPPRCSQPQPITQPEPQTRSLPVHSWSFQLPEGPAATAGRVESASPGRRVAVGVRRAGSAARAATGNRVDGGSSKACSTDQGKARGRSGGAGVSVSGGPATAPPSVSPAPPPALLPHSSLFYGGPEPQHLHTRLRMHRSGSSGGASGAAGSAGFRPGLVLQLLPAAPAHSSPLPEQQLQQPPQPPQLQQAPSATLDASPAHPWRPPSLSLPSESSGAALSGRLSSLHSSPTHQSTSEQGLLLKPQLSVPAPLTRAPQSVSESGAHVSPTGGRSYMEGTGSAGPRTGMGGVGSLGSASRDLAERVSAPSPPGGRSATARGGSSSSAGPGAWSGGLPVRLLSSKARSVDGLPSVTTRLSAPSGLQQPAGSGCFSGTGPGQGARGSAGSSLAGAEEQELSPRASPHGRPQASLLPLPSMLSHASCQDSLPGASAASNLKPRSSKHLQPPTAASDHTHPHLQPQPQPPTAPAPSRVSAATQLSMKSQLLSLPAGMGAGAQGRLSSSSAAHTSRTRANTLPACSQALQSSHQLASPRPGSSLGVGLGVEGRQRQAWAQVKGSAGTGFTGLQSVGEFGRSADSGGVAGGTAGGAAGVTWGAGGGHHQEGGDPNVEGWCKGGRGGVRGAVTDNMAGGSSPGAQQSPQVGHPSPRPQQVPVVPPSAVLDLEAVGAAGAGAGQGQGMPSRQHSKKALGFAAVCAHNPLKRPGG